MSAQWPRVAGWLSTTLPTLPAWAGVTVFAGEPNTGDTPAVYATIGYVPDSFGAGSYSSAQTPDGARLGETGQVRSLIVASSGDTDTAQYVADVFALVDALEVLIRADRTLGGTLSLDSQVSVEVGVNSVENLLGTAASLLVIVHYYTVT
jgi:hypothetical protein